MKEPSVGPSRDSARRHNGGTFAAALTAAMAARKIGVNALAKQVGTSHALVSRWTIGEAIASPAMADQLADVLCDPDIVTAVLAARRRFCKRCYRRFIAVNRNQLYCSSTCKDAVFRARANKRDVSARKLRTKIMERAISLHCNWCQPDGLCRDSKCHLRRVSPLPLIQLTRRAA